eukprot:8763563-Pyramimonas_sp.AAC.1
MWNQSPLSAECSSRRGPRRESPVSRSRGGNRFFAVCGLANQALMGQRAGSQEAKKNCDAR